jgi:hypothetical protein
MFTWAAAVIFLVAWKVTKKKGKLPWFVAPAVLFLGINALMMAPLPWIGGSIAEGVGAVFEVPIGWIASAMHTTGPILATAAIVVLLILAISDLHDKKADKVAKSAMWLLPCLAVIAVGPIAEGVQTVNHSVGTAATAAISNLFH